MTKQYVYVHTDFAMTTMREVLTDLMAANGDTTYSLHLRSGVPASTTQRFLSGKHGEPKLPTVQQWAKCYGISEAQLRGLEPRPDITATPDPPLNALSYAEHKLILHLRAITPEARSYVYKLAAIFAKDTAPPPQREGESFYAPLPTPTRRSGELRRLEDREMYIDRRKRA